MFHLDGTHNVKQGLKQWSQIGAAGWKAWRAGARWSSTAVRGNEQRLVGLDVIHCHTEFIQVASPKYFPGGARTGASKLSD